MCENGDLEKLADKSNARKFLEKIWQLTEELKTGASSCKAQRGDLVTDDQNILNLWREHLYSLLIGSDNETPGDRGHKIPIEDDRKDDSLLRHEEIRTAIVRLKDRKAAGPMDYRPSYSNTAMNN